MPSLATQALKLELKVIAISPLLQIILILKPQRLLTQLIYCLKVPRIKSQFLFRRLYTQCIQLLLSTKCSIQCLPPNLFSSYTRSQYTLLNSTRYRGTRYLYSTLLALLRQQSLYRCLVNLDVVIQTPQQYSPRQVRASRYRWPIILCHQSIVAAFTSLRCLNK